MNFYSKNNKKFSHCSKIYGNGENRMSFIKDVEIRDGKADTIHSALSNEIEKCSGVGFGSHGSSLIIVHEKIDLPLQNSFFKENTFLMKNNNYLICQFCCL